MAASIVSAKLAVPIFLSSAAVRFLPAAAARFPRRPPTAAVSVRLQPRRPTFSPRFFASSVSAPAAATISVGNELPEATLSYFGSDGELKTVTISELTKGKKAVLFAVPGAFTPTCSQKHLPGFVEKAGDLRAKGVDTIACISVNDAFVMRAWKESLKIGDEVLLLADGNGEFTRALRVELDLRDKPVGLGVRSRRYSLLADDGVVKVFNLEEGGAFTFSGADDILKILYGILGGPVKQIARGMSPRLLQQILILPSSG